MQVLHIGKFYPPHFGGIETHLEALSKGVKDYAKTTVVVASEDSRSTFAYIDGVKVIRVGTMATIWSAPICPTMTRVIRNHWADVVHLHLPNPIGMLSYLASGHVGRLVITWHSDVVRQKRLAKLFGPFNDLILHRAQRIIVSSNNYLMCSEALAGHRAKCSVVPYGIATDKFARAHSESKDQIRKTFGSRIVLTVGRLVSYKGLKFLIQAMQFVDAKLLIVGKGPLRSELERLALTLKVTDRIAFLDEVSSDRLAGIYQASDLFVLPSIARSEAFGIVQLEAMAAGKPVINTSIASGVPFVSVDGLTGITVPPGDSLALAGAINLLLGNSELRAKYGCAAAKRVREMFSLERMIDDTLNVYRESLTAARTGVPQIQQSGAYR